MNHSEQMSLLKDLREIYTNMLDWRDDLRIVGEELKESINKTKWCYQCKENACMQDDYYCSEKCKESYYPPSKKRPTIHQMRTRLKELEQQARLKRFTDKTGQRKMEIGY